ncbi:CD48 antigen-like [Garra rufa]|uniref:CD48 antigen-like n=1 Tax=Garra rufa TaxID=137080 RepID=UPI003CCEF83F
MFSALLLFCLCWRWLNGVFGTQTNERLFVTEGDSVTLLTGATEILEDEDLLWYFGEEKSLVAKINRESKTSFTYNDVPDGRFRDRLKLDHQTGSLTITNITTEHSGDYKLEMSGAKLQSKSVSVFVYACLPVPLISSNSSQCSSSSSSQQNCSLLCSVVNVSHVTLSWYKGNSLLSSVSDLSISLSLPLEVEYQDKNTYSCVLNNPISNQTTHLDISKLCHTCAALDETTSHHILTSAALIGSLLVATAVGIFCIYRKHRKLDLEGAVVDDATVETVEITYADPTFRKQNAQKLTATEDTYVEYAPVCMR